MTDDGAYGMLVPIIDGVGGATRDILQPRPLTEADLEVAMPAATGAAVGLVQHFLSATKQ